ncbi:hypothetical protein [Flavobacterium laiguense]|uniref:Uncharacterized protein n=1 Tax=Flavobacterium laiguense TaxID=2169409 RepID=A0A2U1JUT2_9FLAO|nr:hypothetical protein [Flavobacterium laiguense]PWA08967.1 hypothetical protein DB891_09965 [Flavobacterium laiguense]
MKKKTQKQLENEINILELSILHMNLDLLNDDIGKQSKKVISEILSSHITELKRLIEKLTK